MGRAVIEWPQIGTVHVRGGRKVSVTLRKWLEADIDDVAGYASNKKIFDGMRDAFPYPYRRQDAREYILSCIGDDETKSCRRAVLFEGRLAGSIGAFLQNDVYRRSAEIGYWIAEPFWGKGIAGAAIRQLCDHVFGVWDVVRLFAEPYADNAASRKALEKAGFALEGVMRNGVYKNGRLQDYCMYALLKEE